MSVLDINGSEIVWLQNFPNDENVDSIEFGSSKSYFGKKYFPLCYLTDQTHNDLSHFFGINDYHLTDCHYLDHICDFNTVQFNGRSFRNIIFCNPFGIGFQGRGNTKDFLNKAANILKDDGSIHIIGNSSNSWSKYRNAEKYLRTLAIDGELNYNLTISELTALDLEHEYVASNTFTCCEINVTTVPNQMFTIKKLQNVED